MQGHHRLKSQDKPVHRLKDLAAQSLPEWVGEGGHSQEHSKPYRKGGSYMDCLAPGEVPSSSDADRSLQEELPP
jgi:hypothetical protein